jgi:hypothetical protein
MSFFGIIWLGNMGMETPTNNYQHWWLVLVAGIFIAYSLFHLFIYLLDKKNLNLYYAVFTLFGAGSALVNYFSSIKSSHFFSSLHSFSPLFIFLIACIGIGFIAAFFFPNLKMINHRLRWNVDERVEEFGSIVYGVIVGILGFIIYKYFDWEMEVIILILFLISAILALFLYEKGVIWGICLGSSVPIAFFAIKWEFINIVTCLVIVIIIAISIFSVFQKKKGAWIILPGCIGFALFFLLQISNILEPLFALKFIYILGVLCLTISMSIFISLDMVRTSEDNARKTQELEQARQLQLSMLPTDKPSLPHLDIAWYMKTATEVGGDYYDYSLDEKGVITITLGDATGHGMNAGTMVTATKSLFQSHANNPSITETFTVLSSNLKKMNLPRLGMAMTIVKVDGMKYQIASAGMPPVLIYRADSKEVEELELEGMPLGLSTTFEYQQQEFELSTGDTILLMSDGLPERLNIQDEELGYPKTQELFSDLAEKTPDDICSHLAAGGDAWAAGRSQDDDVSFVVLKVVG